MDLAGFNRKFSREFIALYKSFPCLWNTNDEYYKDKNVKHQAFTEMTGLMKRVIPEANIWTVKRKINSMRTTYRRERRKILEKHKNGDIHYLPSLWYYDLLKFTDGGNEGAEIKYESDMLDDSYEMETLENDVLQDTTPENVTCDPLILFSDEKEENQSPTPKKKLKMSKLQRPSTSKIINKDTNASCKLRKASSYSIHEKLNKLLNSKRENNDVFTVFGKYVAMELSKMDEKNAKFCRKIINEAIFEAQMGKLNYFSKVVTPDE